MKWAYRLASLIFAVMVFPSMISTQASSAQRFPDAVRRSQDSAKIIAQLADLASGGIPREVIAKAQAVVIIPNVTIHKLLMEKAIKGSGVASTRQANGWTLPAYYNFAGLGVQLTSLGQESTNIILLFMDKDA